MVALALVPVIAALAVGCGDKGAAGGSATTASPATSALPVWQTRSVDLGGASASVSCEGGGPAPQKTVVFVSGLAEDGQTAWGRSKVPDGVAGDARVCIYDRPGLGASTPSTVPRSIDNQVADLQALVDKGAFPAPVLLVAQGYGSFIARQYAKQHLRDLAGMVLVDPPLEMLDPIAPPGATPGQQAEYAAIVDLNANLGAYGAGALPTPPAPTVILGYDAAPPLPPDAPAGAPTTSTTTPTADGGAPPATTAPDQRRALQQQLARKSPFGSFVFVPGSGTYIQYWKPQAVVDAIHTVLAAGTTGQ